MGLSARGNYGEMRGQLQIRLYVIWVVFNIVSLS